MKLDKELENILKQKGYKKVECPNEQKESKARLCSDIFILLYCGFYDDRTIRLDGKRIVQIEYRDL